MILLPRITCPRVPVTIPPATKMSTSNGAPGGPHGTNPHFLPSRAPGHNDISMSRTSNASACSVAGAAAVNAGIQSARWPSDRARHSYNYRMFRAIHARTTTLLQLLKELAQPVPVGCYQQNGRPPTGRQPRSVLVGPYDSLYAVEQT